MEEFEKGDHGLAMLSRMLERTVQVPSPQMSPTAGVQAAGAQASPPGPPSRPRQAMWGPHSALRLGAEVVRVASGAPSLGSARSL